ncbi:DUF4245 domain-containing protein [Nocardioides massiliensis]|uniref:DUF4245 domain-containing protein n=1 Tax=Nocardioides massiliensis TaxID=1325935 RepID=A0ABT9NJI7_9ACTN|nr:DUF4245 domain-containing protein [Nocardioides massiliensis]MDP9820581.1 hypothetical protein [Nocardioides massiliensis]
MSAPQPAGRPGRYQRSTPALIGSLIVVLAGVGLFVGFRSLVRDDVQVDPRALNEQEYAAVLSAARDQVPAVAPNALPEDWITTSMRFTPEPTPRFHLGMLTDERRYVGVEQSRAAVERMVSTHVDADAVPGDDVEVTDGELAGTWQSWTDDGGDFALTRTFEDTTVLVVGTAGADTITALAASLTTD